MYKILIYSKVFHVRSVTQGDVIRAEAKDIPRIFQVFFFLNNIIEKVLFSLTSALKNLRSTMRFLHEKMICALFHS